MKRTPLKSRSTSDRRKLEAEADRLIQEACRLMFRGRCMRCKHEGHHGHHIIGRANKQTRHALLNVVWLCERCHRVAHSHPREFIEYLRLFWPAIHDWHTRNRNLLPERVTSQHLEATIAELKAFIKRMEDERGTHKV